MDLIGLIPSFGNLALTIIAFLVALTIIVAVHEYGHYIIGRWTGIKADVFSIGIGPVLASRVDRHGTRWQIAGLPVGGYVKFHGDANAASGKADETAMAGMDEDEKRHTLHGAPLWARAATVAAGPVFNFIFSAIVFAIFLMVQGIATDPLTVGKLRDVPGLSGTLAPGDQVLSIGGLPVSSLEEFGALVSDLPDQSPIEYVVARNGAQQTLLAPHPYPPYVGGLSPKSAAIAAGLQVGDLIEAVNGAPVVTFDGLRQIVGTGDGAPLTLDLNRGGEEVQVTLTPKRMDIPVEGGFETRWLIGVTSALIFEPASRTPGPFEAAQAGAYQVWFVITSSLSGLKHMIVGAISSCNLSGPIGIAQVSGQAASQGIGTFISFVALLSTAVGLLNLFPIPVLDGGHLVFHAWEAVSGRPPSDRALNILMTIGLFIVLSIMILGVTNDLFCP